MKRKTSPHQAALTDRTTIKVRFSEIDSMQIVWHGEYVRYFEDGREAFGKRYGLDYMSIYRERICSSYRRPDLPIQTTAVFWRGSDCRDTVYS